MILISHPRQKTIYTHTLNKREPKIKLEKYQISCFTCIYLFILMYLIINYLIPLFFNERKQLNKSKTTKQNKKCKKRRKNEQDDTFISLFYMPTQQDHFRKKDYHGSRFFAFAFLYIIIFYCLFLLLLIFNWIEKWASKSSLWVLLFCCCAKSSCIFRFRMLELSWENNKMLWCFFLPSLAYIISDLSVGAARKHKRIIVFLSFKVYVMVFSVFVVDMIFNTNIFISSFSFAKGVFGIFMDGTFTQMRTYISCWFLLLFSWAKKIYTMDHDDDGLFEKPLLVWI